MKSLLEYSFGYSLLQRAIGATKAHRQFTGYLDLQSGLRYLDVGCGFGQSREFLPEDGDYLGFDVNPRYINLANQRGYKNSVFRVEDIREFSRESSVGFDRILAFGVLHHLDDELMDSFVDLIDKHSHPGTVICTADPYFSDEMSPIARFLIKHDRGKYIRPESEYRRRFAKFQSHQVIYMKKCLNLPYQLLVNKMIV